MDHKFVIAACTLGALLAACGTPPLSDPDRVEAPAPGVSALALPADVFVSTSGSDVTGDGSSGKPYRTLARAASVARAGQTVRLAAGRFVETRPALVAPGVNVRGAGRGVTVLESSGVAYPPDVDPAAPATRNLPEGSLIQLVSPAYPNNARSGRMADLLATVPGNQKLSGFTVKGLDRLKAGVWVQNRSNVTLENLDFDNLAERGAVVAKGPLEWYVPLPDGKWVRNTTVRNVRFVNSSRDFSDESTGNLNLGGLDGALIENVSISDTEGYGIKFIYTGHFRHTTIRNARIRLSEADALWKEDAAIELWNLSRGNSVSRVDANTWFSFVNHGQIEAYQPVGTATDNLTISDNTIVDIDGASAKEAMEIGLSGVRVLNNHIRDKGFGLAIWNASGRYTLKNYDIRRNVIANVRRAPAYGFGDGAAVFVPDAASRLRITNNVFDRMTNAVSLKGANDVEVRNNIFLDTLNFDLDGGSAVLMTHNLRDSAGGGAWRLNGSFSTANNLVGNPQLAASGDRVTSYYRPAGPNSAVVDKGVNVGLPFLGTAPDIGAFEWGQP